MPNPMPPTTPCSLPTAAGVVRSVGLSQPLQWLRLGWVDMVRCGWVSYLHGLAMAGFGAMTLWLASDRFGLLLGAFSGFLLVAPILATGLYALSRALERGETADHKVVLRTWLNWQGGRMAKWSQGHWYLLQFGLLLAGAGTAWVLLSAALMLWLAPVAVNTPMVFVEQVLLAKEGFLLETWLAAGGALAAPIFASTVVTVPLLLDRAVSIRLAVGTSWQVILQNPVPMALWSTLILGLTVCGFALALTGLVLIVPWLGHASWHAYRDLVDASALPQREWR